VWDPEQHPTSWRAVWQYSRKRALRDNKTLTVQENKARAIIDGEKTAKAVRFVKTTATGQSLDEKSLARAGALVGLKGYVTNIDAATMSASEVIGKYHDLWHVEQSFRMSKTDLQARPVFHHTREAIEAHLTIVFTALAVARFIQNVTGFSIRHVIRTLKPLQDVTIQVAGQELTAQPKLTDDARHIVDSVTH
jgi:transposase